MSEDEKKTDDDAANTDDPKDDAVSENEQGDAPEEKKAEDEKSAAEEVLEEKSAAEKVLDDSDKAEEPKAEEKAEEPKAEEPKAEEPKAEEPKAEEPKAEEKAEEPAADEPESADEPEPVVAGESLGFLIEFETEETLKTACESVRDAGYSSWDAHTPYPVHGLDEAMGIRPTILPWIVFFGGLTGCMTGLILQAYTNGITLPFSLQGTLIDPFLPSGYPYITSGKPVFSVPANIPVAFELTILLSAFGAFFGMWGLNQLPRFHHPVFSSERFRRSTQDRYFISIESTDPLFDRDRTLAFAQRLGGSHLEELVEVEE